MPQSGRNDQLWQPTTFLERGVAVPFTTPILSGTRARPAAAGVELVVPHPAGARGVYIMAWSELPNFCAATLHDLMLSERLASLKTVTPRDIRGSARAVAALGAAGHAARAAAAAAEKADMHERLMTNVLLLQFLVEQSGGGPCPPTELDRRAKAAILRLAPEIGRSAEAITNDIEEIAARYSSVGVGPALDRARCHRLADMIQRVVADIKPLADRFPGQTGLAASLITAAAEVTLALARRTLTDTQGRLADLPALISAWAADPAGIAAVLARPEWLLDGWEQICLVWHLSEDDRCRASISEMALMVPVIPKEASDWLSQTIDEGERQRLRKLVHSYEDWRTGSLVFELIARNEQIRAIAA